MGQYTNKGLYNGYKKNQKERAELDYYATPTDEVVNILKTLKEEVFIFDSNDGQEDWCLEPCCGGGHMIEGIRSVYPDWKIVGTDYVDRGYHPEDKKIEIITGLDFLDDNYPIDSAPFVIMNPPYATLEPFIIRGLEIAKKYLIVLCRTQALEGSGRYENIYADNPPSYIFQYVDRIQCWKNGKEPEGSSAQAYCWLVWDIQSPTFRPEVFWIRRVDKA